MAETLNYKGVSNRNLAAPRAGRSLKLLGLTRITYIGMALTRLQAWERKLDREWRALDDECPDIVKRIGARCQLVKALDELLDRRRILCGDPLPRGGGSKPATRTLDLEPQSVPEPPMPDPGQGVD